MIGHDPHKQIGYIQQSLSADKKPLGIFVGAGCPTAIKSEKTPAAPLIPDIKGMTELVQSKLCGQNNCKGLLKAVETNFCTDGKKDASIEDVLTHLRALRYVAGKETVRGLTAENLDLLDAEICQCIYELVNKELPDTATPYHRIAAWIDAIGRERPVEIFTTNYDLLMEQAFEDFRVPYFDGFAGARRPFFDLRAMEEDSLPPRWARLWKLHGSINWHQIPGKGVFRGQNPDGNDVKRVIHPSHLKYEESRRMPYLAMMDRLRAFLKQPTATLLLSGYSFRDEHINEVIVQGLQSTPTAIAFALLFGELKKYPAAVELAKKRPNLTLLAEDSAVISGVQKGWLERGAEALPPGDGRYVTWVPLDKKDKNSQQRACFKLGDFARLGDFFHELVGEVHLPPEKTDGK